MDNVLLFLGLMRRAQALAIGGEDSCNAARAGKARLLLIASDAAKNTGDGMENARTNNRTPLLHLPYTKTELGAALGRKECAALAVLDPGFAKALCEKLGMENEAAALRAQLPRAERRKEKNKAGTYPLTGAMGRIIAKRAGTSRATDKRGK